MSARILAAALAAATLFAAAPARAAVRYVALGDSFAAGVGTRLYFEPACRRSPLAFPYLLVRSRPGIGLWFAACSGATVADVASTQLGALSPDTALVTVLAGGNDAGFRSVLTECAKPAWLSGCAGRVASARAFVRDVLPGRLDALYARIAAAAPRARVVVVGYPRLFDGRDCDAVTFFSPDDERRLNAAADLLAAVTAQRARAHGFAFADARPAFAGHALCDPEPWLNRVSAPLGESWHPNADGQRLGYLPLVLRALGSVP